MGRDEEPLKNQIKALSHSKLVRALQAGGLPGLALV